MCGFVQMQICHSWNVLRTVMAGKECDHTTSVISGVLSGAWAAKAGQGSGKARLRHLIPVPVWIDSAFLPFPITFPNMTKTCMMNSCGHCRCNRLTKTSGMHSSSLIYSDTRMRGTIRLRSDAEAGDRSQLLAWRAEFLGGMPRSGRSVTLCDQCQAFAVFRIC